MSNFNVSFSPGPRVHTTNLHANSSFMVHPPPFRDACATATGNNMGCSIDFSWPRHTSLVVVLFLCGAICHGKHGLQTVEAG